MNIDQITLEELNDKTLTQIKDIAKEIGIKSISKYKKGELIELIIENSNSKQKNDLEKNDDIKMDEVVENRSYVKTYENRNNRNNINRNYYTQKVVDESKIIDEFNTSKDDEVMGVLEILPDGFGFLRVSNFLSTEIDVYVSPSQIR